MTRTGIIAPMPVEASHLAPPSALGSAQTVDGLVVYRWETSSHQVTLACSGMGLRRASQAARRLIEQDRVERLIVSGVAGGLVPESPLGTLVIPEAVCAYRGKAEKGFIAQGPTGSDSVGPAYQVDTALWKAAADASPSRSAGGLLVSVKGLVTSPSLLDWFRQGLGATAVDMESAAVGEACAQAGVPFLVIRALSDHAPELARWDWAGLAQARKRGRLPLTAHMMRRLALAARLRRMKRDVDRGAREAARVVKRILASEDPV
ncbi:MAG: 5'-methylthioadenosine/S-adenosylhomocysteine nucleosidase [Dehalococcoidia bacterium]|nr:5'-methylthioadenosine/S-adenosylhomocysteine nucleosidase [Dehalococcoidia bacterium]